MDPPSLTQREAERSSSGRLASAVSNSVVSLFAEYVGRGPTRARTSFGRDLVTVVLEETLTKAERHLVEDGEVEAVLEVRRAFQRAMRADLIAVVERHTGRRVSTLLSDQSVDPDVAVEVFVLTSGADEPGSS